MRIQVILRPHAEADLLETFSQFEDLRTGLGRRFISRIRQALDRVAEMPELYGRVWNEVRAVRVAKFRHIIYYVHFSDRAEVVAILHAARDPAIWQSRL